MKKDVKFSTRMASTDREAIKELAKQSGMSMSDYVTACCLGKQVVVIDGLKEVLKSLLAEKKETPFYLIPKQRELSRRITELTEELEELKSEKDMLLHSLECSDDAGIATVKKDISTLEAALKKLAQQEEKYTDELNDALRQYADLKEQTAEFDPEELQDARCALRPAMERSAVDRVQSAYGNKYDPLMMYDGKRDVAGMLNEHEEKQSVRKFLREYRKLPAKKERTVAHCEQEL